MALRALMIRKKLDTKKNELEQLRSKDADFEKREAELEQAIEEAETEEEKNTVEEEVGKFEEEKKEHEESKKNLEEEVRNLEADLEKEEKTVVAPVQPPADEREGEETVKMSTRKKFFGMNSQERDAFFANEGVKNLLDQVRSCMREKRALNNVGLLIPDVMLDLLREQIEETSKLIQRVNKRSVGGKARQRIMGSIPEAIWTEMCGKLNELDLGFNDVEVDGYKVGGFFAICNAILEDNDINLATEIINALAKAIGKALDKAIIYGTGTKMPLGIVTRLAQTVEPSDYPSTAIPWKDLHASNVLQGTGATGINLFKEIVNASGVLKDDYSASGVTWIMNKKTHMALTVQSMDKNMNAAIVAGINNQMPVAGGEIVDLSFIPDNNIIFGYMDMYLLAERAGTELGQSEHVRFIEDQTVFKGTARYDGLPVIPDAFAMLTIDTSEPVTSVAFPTDKANA